MQIDRQSGKRNKIVFEAAFSPVSPVAARFYDAPVPVKGREHFAAKATYFVLWGLVWGVFSNPVYDQALNTKRTVPWSVVKTALHRWRANDDEEVVVLLQGLGGSACTMSYDTSVMRILQYFNGKKVNNMRDLVNYALEAELNAETFMRITFTPLADEDLAGSEKDPDIVLHRKFCGMEDRRVLAMNNIPQQFSDDVSVYVQEALQARNLKFDKGRIPSAHTSQSFLQAGSQEALHSSNIHENIRTITASRPRSAMEVSNTDSFDYLVKHATKETKETGDSRVSFLSEQNSAMTNDEDTESALELKGQSLQEQAKLVMRRSS